MQIPGAWYWVPLGAVSFFPQGSFTVTVKAQSTVVTDQSADKVTLPCEYELDNPGQVYNIRWDIGRDVVIVKDTANQLFYGSKYTGRVKWGEGCSLILLRPSLNDTGRYQFNIAALEDQNPWETAYIQLIVRETGIRKTTPGEISAPQSTVPTPAVTPTADGSTSPVQGQVVHAAFLIIINIVALVSQTRKKWTSGQIGRTDGFRRLCLGSPAVLFGIGAVTSVVSVIMRSNVVTIVSFVALGLGIGTDGIFWIIKSKESVGKNVNEVEEEREKMYPSSTPSEGRVLLTTNENDKKTDRWDEVRLSNKDEWTPTKENNKKTDRCEHQCLSHSEEGILTDDNEKKTDKLS